MSALCSSGGISISDVFTVISTADTMTAAIFLDWERCSENTLTYWSSSALRLSKQQREWWHDIYHAITNIDYPSVCSSTMRARYDLRVWPGIRWTSESSRCPTHSSMRPCRRPLWMPSWWKRSHSGRFPFRWVGLFTRYSQRYCTWVDMEIQNLEFSPYI